MTRFLPRLSISLAIFIVTGIIALFLQKPPLLDGISFSRAVYDEQDRLLRLTLTQDEKYRLYVPLNEISPQLIEASLLQEDKYFRLHPGFNPSSLLKAVWTTYMTHTRRIGGSTITMQLARIRYGIRSKNISGKCLQILRALQLEMHYSKNQILEAYLNLAPYGNNIEGVGAASLIYFNTPAKKLSLPQALALAVIPQNPLQRTPDQQNLKKIRDRLFALWVHTHPADQIQRPLMQLPLQTMSMHHLPFFAPHFVSEVLKKGGKRDFYKIITTLNLNLQKTFETITHHYLNQKKSLGVNNAAVLLVDSRDMSVKVMLGSANFFDNTIGGQINGTAINRSPGSTLKPFIYALAIDQGLIHPNTVLKDIPHSFGHYTPDNFDYDFMGPVHAKDALILSRNIPAIYLADQLAHPNLYDLLQAAHINHLQPESYYGLALTLGGAELSMQELAALYAALANEGQWQPLRFLKNEKQAASQRLLSAEASFLILDILKNTPQPEENSFISEHLKKNISWKTGTSSGYRDAWAIGLAGPYVLAVWIGNFDNTANHAFVGKNIAAPLFFELAAALSQTVNVPALSTHLTGLNIKQIPVCKASGMLPTRYCQETETTWFIPGKSPIKTDTIFREVPINKKTGLRTCHFDQNTEFKIYEFWPSDLLKIFKEAGIQRRVPPPVDASCSNFSFTGFGPQITSPQQDTSYILRAGQPAELPLTAVADADVKTIYWFINNTFLAKSTRDRPFIWHPKPGTFTVRAVDDHGRTDAKEIAVKLAIVSIQRLPQAQS